MHTEGIKYIGSKLKLLPNILDVVSGLTVVNSVLDLFSGTTRVSQVLKHSGYLVGSNDIALCSFLFSKAYIENSSLYNGVEDDLYTLNSLEGIEGFITRNYAEGATSNNNINDIMYWRRFNTLKADAIRAEIDKMYTSWSKEWCILLSSLVLALDRVDNTVGVQQAFLKNSWSQRSSNKLFLQVPNITSGRCGKSYNKDSNVLVREVSKDFDLVYVDPPYTSHNYISYYHIWETLIRNDNPQVSGIVNRRVNYTKSDYNTKKAPECFFDLLKNINSKYILISYNDEGIIKVDDMTNMCLGVGKLDIFSVDYKRNVMSQIGICNKDGNVVGVPGKRDNKEFLFLISR
jgi:adenine-specific DNA-methyltransferase